MKRSRFHKNAPRLWNTLEDVLMRSASRVAVVLHSLWRRPAKHAFGILTYHRTAPAVPGFPEPLHNVFPPVFRRQLQGLLKRGFEFRSLDDVLRRSRPAAALSRKTAVVTFDDGFETVYTQAWPVLRELRIPATIFVNTAYLDRDAPFPIDQWGMRWFGHVDERWYRPLRHWQCEEMLASGLIQLGAHTHTHEDFRGRPEEFESDLRINLKHLQDRFQMSRIPFAFPFGSTERGFAGGALTEAARRAGVTCALTTDPFPVQVGSDPFYWGRFNAFSWDTAASLEAKINGFYSWAPRWKRALARGMSREVAVAPVAEVRE